MLELVIRGVCLLSHPYLPNHHDPSPSPSPYTAKQSKATHGKTNKAGLSRPKHPLQCDNVGALHARPHRVPLHHQSLHHQHVGEFPGHRVAGDARFSGAGWGVVVGWGGDDGGWVYSCGDEGCLVSGSLG